MHIQTITVLIAALGLTSTLSFANDMSAEELLNDLHRSNKAEIAIGALAQKRGNSEGVRKYGARLVKDHTKADEKLQKTAKEEKITLKDPEFTSEQKDLQEKLQKARGSDFDEAFLEGMESDHKKEVEKVRDAKVEDKKVQKLAKEILPTLEQHHKMAMRLQKAEK